MNVAFPMKSKADVLQYVEMATARFGTRMCSFRCDNGGEYLSEEMKDYFRSK
jgi:hypothetical protein